jgi:outer membrane cobalamin receptor
MDYLKCIGKVIVFEIWGLYDEIDRQVIASTIKSITKTKNTYYLNIESAQVKGLHVKDEGQINSLEIKVDVKYIIENPLSTYVSLYDWTDNTTYNATIQGKILDIY